MAHVPEEILMAYVDRQLPPDQVEWLEAALATDAVLRKRLAPYLFFSGEPLRQIFGQPMREPVPDRLLAVINQAGRAEVSRPLPQQRAARPSTAGLSSAGQGRGLFEALGDLLFPGGFRPVAAFAYSALLIAGVGIGWLAGQTQGPTGGLVAGIDAKGSLGASNRLQHALETQRSGGPAPLEASGSPASGIYPVLTFRSQDGQLCRQYVGSDDDSRRFAGVACRAGANDWRVVFHSETATPSARDASFGGSAAIPGQGQLDLSALEFRRQPPHRRRRTGFAGRSRFDFA